VNLSGFSLPEGGSQGRSEDTAKTTKPRLLLSGALFFSFFLCVLCLPRRSAAKRGVLCGEFVFLRLNLAE
jgi:hypothetical protein